MSASLRSKMSAATDVNEVSAAEASRLQSEILAPRDWALRLEPSPTQTGKLSGDVACEQLYPIGLDWRQSALPELICNKIEGWRSTDDSARGSGLAVFTRFNLGHPYKPVEGEEGKSVASLLLQPLADRRWTIGPGTFGLVRAFHHAEQCGETYSPLPGSDLTQLAGSVCEPCAPDECIDADSKIVCAYSWKQLDWQPHIFSHALRILRLDMCGLEDLDLLQLSEFVRCNGTLTTLSIQNNRIQGVLGRLGPLASALNRSIVQDLAIGQNDIPGSRVAHFLDQLDTPHLLYLDISVKDKNTPEQPALVLGVVKLIRKTTGCHGTVGGTPNLLRLTVGMLHCGFPCRALLTAALKGYKAAPAHIALMASPRRPADALCPSHPIELLGWRDEYPGRTVSYADVQLMMRELYTAGGHGAEKKAPEIERDASVLYAAAVHSTGPFVLEPAAWARPPGTPPTAAALRQQRVWTAAWRLYQAARLLTCCLRIVPGPERRASWLGFSPSIRHRILTDAFDPDRLFSLGQLDRILSYAADPRTLGYGRTNEVLLYEKRLADEATNNNAPLDGNGHALVDVPVWSWWVMASAPMDWKSLHFDHGKGNWQDLHELEAGKPEALLPECQAMLRATGCIVGRG